MSASFEILEERAFGADGRWRRIRGRVDYRVAAEHYPEIVDLDTLAVDGEVRMAGDFVLVRPAAGAPRALLVDVPNRGRPLSFSMFNRLSRSERMADAAQPGDGWLARCGMAVLSVGWQVDLQADAGLRLEAPRAHGRRAEVASRFQPNAHVASAFHGQPGARIYEPDDPHDAEARLYRREHPGAALELVPRERWRFARQRAGGGEIVPDPRCVWLEGGFEPGVAYTVVYRSSNPPVVGCGLIALRDAALAARSSAELGPAPHVLAFGASQTGRLLRHFLSLGLNAVGPGRVFDGALIHIAGAQRGDFNHRGAQPGSLGVPSLGQRPPFELPAAAAPKTLHTNTSWEYWRGDGALVHVGLDGPDRNLAEHERAYLFAGSHHIGPILPPARALPELGLRTREVLNVVDTGPLLRAALFNLLQWVAAGVEPPPSCVPRLADGSAVERAAVLAKVPDAHLDPRKLGHLAALDLGPEADLGLPRHPAIEGEPLPALVADVDDDGNERAGIRLPDLSVPVGVHSGWNPRAPEIGAGDQPALFAGFSRLFSPAELERRYGGRERYAQRVRSAALELVDAGYLLATDLEVVVNNCLARYDLAARGTDGERHG